MLMMLSNTGPTEFNSGMAMSTAMHNICQQVLYTVNSVARNSEFLQIVFAIVLYIIVLNLLYEATKIILHASHKSLWALASPEFIRKFIRALLCGALGLGAYSVLIWDADTNQKVLIPAPWVDSRIVNQSSKPFLMFATNQHDIEDAMFNITNAYANNYSGSGSGEEYQLMIDTAVAELKSQQNLSPEVMLHSIGSAVRGAASKLDAWAMVKTMQEEALVKLAMVAADEVLKEAAASGAPPTPVPVTSEDSTEEKADQMIGKIMDFITPGITIGINTLVNVAITAAYFCMDLVVCKILWLNALYMATAYKLALVLLPVGILLAYWPSTTSILVNLGKLVLVGALTLKIMAVCTVSLLNPDFIRDAVVQHFQVDQTDISERIKNEVRSIYIAELKESKGSDKNTSSLGRDKFMQVVENTVRGQSLAAFNLTETGGITVILPLIAMIGLGFLVSVIGKIGMIVQDTLAGTMTYHKGG